MSETRYTLTITDVQAGQRLDKALTLLLQEHEMISRVRVQALLEDGHVSLNGAVVTNSKTVTTTGQVYEVELIREAIPDVAEAQEIPLDIVYEDEDVIVINKPAGLVVHPAAGNYTGTLVNALLWHRGDELSGIGGVQRPGIVHRLDKDTSGLMVVAKHDSAHHALSKQFEKRTLSRTYLAVVWGVPMPREGTIDAPIARSKNDRKKMAVVEGGKAARTHYAVEHVLAAGALSLIRCTLETGRTHQIRVHLTHLGNPLIGDQVYTGNRRRGLTEPYTSAVKHFPRQALHAAELHFISPKTGEMMEFSADLPQDMSDLLKQLETR